jgi:hypothetical protein
VRSTEICLVDLVRETCEVCVDVSMTGHKLVIFRVRVGDLVFQVVNTHT